MTNIEYLNPPMLHKPVDNMYAHVCRAEGAVQYRIGGQVAVDAAGKNVAVGDMRGQIEACYRLTTGVLDSLGLSWPNVTHLLTFTTDMDEYLKQEQLVARKYFGDTPPPSTLVAVPRLVDREWLVEVQTDAASDR